MYNSLSKYINRTNTKYLLKRQFQYPNLSFSDVRPSPVCPRMKILAIK